VAVATALLPGLSAHIQAGEHEKAARMTDQSITLVMLFGIPSCLALLSIANPIINVIFEHGAFDATDRAATAPALVAYAAGIPAFLLIKVFATHFYAAQDTKTPVKIATLCVIINLTLNLILMQYFAHVGLAIATTIAGWVNALLMGIALKKRGAYSPTPSVYGTIGKFLSSALVMVVILELVWMATSPLYHEGIVIKSAALIGLIIAGTITYFTMAFATGAVSLPEVKKMLQKSSR
jgi:putative peptidoglycan lipid II flippase